MRAANNARARGEGPWRHPDSRRGSLALGTGALILGVRPLAVGAVTYGLLAWSFLVELLSGLVNASHWVLDTSLFHQMAAASAIGPNWTGNAILIMLGLAASGVGAVASTTEATT